MKNQILNKNYLWQLCLQTMLLLSLAFAAQSFAAEPTAAAAKEMVVKQAQRILAQLNSQSTRFRDDPEAFAKLVNEEVLPYLDVELMSRIVLARHWRSASAKQQQDFTAAFAKLLVRVYSRGWTNYTGASVEVLGEPVLDKYKRTKLRVQVIDNNGKKAIIEFSAHFSNGAWKLYDVAFEGVSILNSYRNSFDSEINKFGLDNLIAKVEQMRPDET